MCLKSTTSKLMSIHSTTKPRSPATVSPSSGKAITSIAPSNPSQKMQRKEGQTRRVRFSHARVVGTVVDRSVIPVEHHRDIWYLASELEEFKNEIRPVCQQIRDNGFSNGNAAAYALYNTADFSTRGLEQRMCKNRQRNKALAVWGTLKAQQRNNNPEFIAMIARKCSYTAAQLAYMEAARDYCEIYNPGKIASLSAQIESFASQSFPIKLKRKSSDSDSSATDNSNGRNVRIRIN